MSVLVHEWGARLGDAVRAALDGDDIERARQLVLEGDGQTRSLATEFTFMVRGLGITLGVMLRLLGETAERADGGSGAATAELSGLVHRFSADIAGRDARAAGPAGDLDESLGSAARTLEATRAHFEREQARLAEEIVRAIDEGDSGHARALLDTREKRHYLPYHDVLLRFMAESFGWVLRWFGPQELLRFHLATAEGQRAGFEKWERMPAADFARMTAFLLKQHMGNVSVVEDEEKFTIEQAPCGSGGRLRLAGAYEGSNALPFVETPGPLTFGQDRLPVYCSHCAIWNGAATLRWFGRAQWVFDRPSRADGACTLHIYKQPGYTPPAYAARVAVPEGDA